MVCCSSDLVTVLHCEHGRCSVQFTTRGILQYGEKLDTRQHCRLLAGSTAKYSTCFSNLKLESLRSEMAECERRLVMSGDIIAELSDSGEGDGIVTLGPGLRRDQAENVVATKCGFLRKKGQSTFWVDSYQKHYVPSRGECVLGIVTAKLGDIFRVNIGASDQASLSYLSFEGATKRNRPNIQIGDVVYAKVLVAIKDMEPELVCVDRHGKAAGLGVPSEGGFLFQVSLNLIRKLLSPSCCLMKALGQHFKFETAIGMNGRVWVKGMSVKETIVLSNAMSLSENMTEDEIKIMVNRLVDAMAGFQ